MKYFGVSRCMDCPLKQAGRAFWYCSHSSGLLWIDDNLDNGTMHNDCKLLTYQELTKEDQGGATMSDAPSAKAVGRLISKMLDDDLITLCIKHSICAY